MRGNEGDMRGKCIKGRRGWGGSICMMHRAMSKQRASKASDMDPLRGGGLEDQLGLGSGVGVFFPPPNQHG